ncbi:MAG: O-antigen ligase family protein [Anaerolineae bacterium]
MSARASHLDAKTTPRWHWQHLSTTLVEGDSRAARRTLWLLIVAAALLLGLYVALLGPTYAIAGALGLAAAYLVLRSTRWGFILLAAVIWILPFAAFPFKLGFTPTFLDAALLALFFVWLVRIATGQDRTFVFSPLGGLVLLFMALAMFTFVLGSTHARPTQQVLRQFIEVVISIALFFVSVNEIRTRQDVDWLTRVLIIGGGLCALIAIIFYVIPDVWTVRILDALARLKYPGGYGALRYIEDDPNNPMRAIGLAVDPNVLGGMMILAAGLTAPQFFSRSPLLPRFWTSVIFLVQVLALYLTYSRSALMGLGISLFILASLKYRRLLWLGLLGAVLLLLLPQTEAYVARLLAGLRGEDLATQMRFGEYKDALLLIGRYPWFGVGFSGTPDIDLYIGVSSAYLLMAEEMGLSGLLVFLTVLAGFFAFLWRTWRGGLAVGRDAVLLGLVGALAGALAAATLDHYLFNLTYPHMSSLLWLYIGLAVAAALVERAAPAAATQGDRSGKSNMVERDSGQEIADRGAAPEGFKELV